MKTFHQFVIEADLRDKEGLGHGTGMTHRGGEKIGAERKKTGPEKRRTKAVGGGKTAPAKSYKPRKDIGVQRPQSQRVSNQRKKEVVLHYLLKKHNAKHTENARQERRVVLVLAQILKGLQPKHLRKKRK